MPRKLRIAVSAFFGVLTLLLVVLWVRSYWWGDQLEFPLPATHGVAMNSLKGRVLLAVFGTGSSVVVTGVFLEHHEETDYELGNSKSFDLSQLGSEYSVLVPYWLLAVLCTVFATVVWLPISFSLRTLLIATTLLAVVLGLAAWAGR